MATTFPTTIDAFINPSASDQVGVDVGGRTHSEFHSDNNDALEAIEAKVGVDGSAVTTSHDYKLSGVTGADKAASLTGTETLSGKTLTAPKFVDGGFIADANGNEILIIDTTTSAVNELTLFNNTTGNNPGFTATGSDSNIGIDLNTKGTGAVHIKGNATQSGAIRIYEDTDNGLNYTAITVGTQSADITYTLPTSVASAGQFLSDAAGNGTLSWASVGATVTATVNLSSADILALHTTPKTLVAAQGAGTVIIVDSVVMSLDSGTQYANGAAPTVNYSGDSVNLVNRGNNNITSATDIVWSLVPISSSNGSELILTAGNNVDVVLTTTTQFITGTGTLKVFISYKVITL